MEKRKVKLLNSEVGNIYGNFIAISNIVNIPLKRCIAENIEIINYYYEDINKKRNDILSKYVVLDEDGFPCVKDGFNKDKELPIHAFIFENESDEPVAKEEISNFDNSTITIEIYKEDINKKIRVKSIDGGYDLIRLTDILDDPSNNLCSGHIVLFNKFLLFDSITENI